MDDEVFRQITRVREYFSDPHNYALLLLHTKAVASMHQWFGAYGQSMPKANLAADVLHSLIAQVLDEDVNSPTRHKLPEHVEIGVALRIQIRSKIDGLFKSKENSTLRRETDLDKDEDEDDFTPSVLEYGKPFWGQPDEENDDLGTPLAERIDRFLEFVSGDHLVHAMITLARDEGIYKPAEAALRLDVTVNDIYIAKKRMFSAGDRFIKAEQNPQ